MANTAKLVLETVEGEGLRFGVTTGSRQRTVIDSGPGMVAPSPVESLLIAVAGCISMDVISILRKKRQRVTGYEIEASGERRTDHPRAFTRIDLLHRLRGHDLSVKAIEEAIELSRKYCSVQASLDSSIPVTNRVEIVTDAAV
jgi:putative redox protein